LDNIQNYTYEHKGYILQQTSYNWHYMWTAYLKGKGLLISHITAEDVGWMMVCVKAARASTAEEPKRDTFVDAAGYAACAAECAFGSTGR